MADYPINYFQRGKESDIKLILQRMAVIPDSKKAEIIDTYERFNSVEGGDARRLANTYLDTEARKYRNAPRKTLQPEVSAKMDSKPPESSEAAFKYKIDTSRPVKRESFLDSLLDDVDKNYRRK